MRDLGLIGLVSLAMALAAGVLVAVAIYTASTCGTVEHGPRIGSVILIAGCP